MQILRHFTKWVLRLDSKAEPAESESNGDRPDCPAAEAVQKYIRLSPDAAVAGQKRLSQESKNCSQAYEKTRFVV